MADTEDKLKIERLSQRITQLECSLYLALSALDFEAGEWNEEAILRHQREQIEIARNYLRKAFDQEMTDRLAQLFQLVVESRPFDLPQRFESLSEKGGLK